MELRTPLNQVDPGYPGQLLYEPGDLLHITGITEFTLKAVPKIFGCLHCFFEEECANGSPILSLRSHCKKIIFVETGH